MKSIKNLLVFGLLFLCQNLFSQTLPICENPNVIQKIATYPIDKNQELVSPTLLNPPTASMTPNYRLVFWVHGLGAQYSTSWAKASAASELGAGTSFPARKVHSYTMDYNETGIEAAGNELRNDMVPIAYSPAYEDLEPEKNFIIAHSQGGIVSREIDLQYFNDGGLSQSIGGIVTFGSPHQGARILNNKTMIQEAMADACASLTLGPVLDAISNPILDLFINDGVVKSTVSSYCTTIGNTLPNFIKAYDTGTTHDYFVGADKINELNSQETWAIEHKLGTYGVEYAGTESTHNPKALFWRSMSNFKTQDPEQQPYFGADDDNQLVNGAVAQLATYVAGRNAAQSTMSSLESLGFPCNTYAEWILWGPITCHLNNNKHRKAKTKRDAFQKGINWFMNVDETYKTLIGAVDQELKQTCICTKLDPEGDLFSLAIPAITNAIDCAAYPANSTWDDCVWKEAIQSVRKESDGVVLRESAENFPGAAGYFRMDKTNHFQMRNNSETKKALLWIYNSSSNPGGLASPDPFFNTAPK